MQLVNFTSLENRDDLKRKVHAFMGDVHKRANRLLQEMDKDVYISTDKPTAILSLAAVDTANAILELGQSAGGQQERQQEVEGLKERVRKLEEELSEAESDVEHYKSRKRSYQRKYEDLRGENE